MESNYPLVTVFTLIYNTKPKYVIEAIESIRANNYPNIQHIIIDDCSPNPEPKRVIKEWIDRENYPCEFYEHEVNFGVCKTLNQVLELAKGEFIFGCSDDIIMPNKIITEVELLSNLDDTYAAVYSDAILIDEKSNPRYGLFIQKYRSFDYLPDVNLYEVLLEGNFLPVMSMMWRTHAIREIGGYDEEISYEDHDLHLRLTRSLKYKNTGKVLAKYRIHKESLIHNTKNQEIDLIKIYLKHIDQSEAQIQLRNHVYHALNNSQSLNNLRNAKIRFPLFWIILIILFPKPIRRIYSFVLGQILNMIPIKLIFKQ